MLMDITKHVIDYETAMRFKKGGIKQDSLFYWCFPEGATEPQLMNFSIYDFKHDPTFEAHLKKQECAAFMLSELLDLLPDTSLSEELNAAIGNLERYYSPNA